MSALATLSAAYETRRSPADLDNCVGYVGLDTPVELITAAGFRPLRLIVDPLHPDETRFGEGAGHPLMRAVCGAIETGAYRGLKRLILTTTPSYYATLFTALREIKRQGAGFEGLDVVLFDLNRSPGPLLDGMRRDAVLGLRAQLSGWRGTAVTDEAIGHSIALHNRLRAALRKVEALREAGRLTGVQALTVFGAAETLAPAEAIAALDALAAEPLAARDGLRTLYSGAETPTPDLYARLESEGRLIVADDQDAGSRTIGPDVAETGDPYAALAARYFARDPGAARWSISDRAAYLTGVAERAGAKAAVFNLPPYDHPPAWDQPTIAAALAARGVEVSVL